MNPSRPNGAIPHIAVCVCTFKRPHLLKQLLSELIKQKTASALEYSVTVVDNDESESAREVVTEVMKASPIPINYQVEPQQNIALARNKAVNSSPGDFIAFIDDDEVPVNDWLVQLFETCVRYNVDGVLGPVLPRYEGSPPAWLRRGRFCDRPVHDTGFVIDQSEGRTGNLLVRRAVLDQLQPVFRPQFASGGEDRDLFRRLIANNHRFVWCNEAKVFERVSPARWRRRVMLRRALLRGKMASNENCGPLDVAKSFSAVIGYALALPVLFFVGHHLFMRYLIKTFDHAGKLLALAGLHPVKETYVLE